MNRWAILSTLLGLAKSITDPADYQPGVPDRTGAFFYLELDRGLDSNNIDVSEYKHIYHTNVFAGSEKVKTELWLSTMEHQLSFFKGESCTNCHINGGWNP